MYLALPCSNCIDLAWLFSITWAHRETQLYQVNPPWLQRVPEGVCPSRLLHPALRDRARRAAGCRTVSLMFQALIILMIRRILTVPYRLIKIRAILGLGNRARWVWSFMVGWTAEWMEVVNVLAMSGLCVQNYSDKCMIRISCSWIWGCQFYAS